MVEMGFRGGLVGGTRSEEPNARTETIRDASVGDEIDELVVDHHRGADAKVLEVLQPHLLLLLLFAHIVLQELLLW